MSNFPTRLFEIQDKYGLTSQELEILTHRVIKWCAKCRDYANGKSINLTEENIPLCFDAIGAPTIDDLAKEIVTQRNPLDKWHIMQKIKSEYGLTDAETLYVYMFTWTYTFRAEKYANTHGLNFQDDDDIDVAFKAIGTPSLRQFAAYVVENREYLDVSMYE